MIWFFANYIGKNIGFKCQLTSLSFVTVIMYVNYSIKIEKGYIIVHKLLGTLSLANIVIIHSNANKNMKNVDFVVIDSAF
jgi:hypothetical protein